MIDLWQKIVEVVIIHPYLYLFIGLVFGGESVLLPAIYLAILGKLELPLVFSLSIFATIISDSFWYFIGRRVPHNKLLKFVGELRTWAERLSALFVRNSFFVIILSKFMYGTRTATQILAGVYKVTFHQYILADIIGVLGLNVIFVIFSILARAGSLSIEDFSKQVTVSLVVLGTLAVLFHIVAKKFIMKKWFQ